MGLSFKADEIIRFAVDNEENAAQFYRRAADLKEAEGDVSFLREMAEMEEDHAATFAGFSEELSAAERGATGADPDDEADLFLAAMSASHGGEGDPAEREKLTGEESLAEILRTGVRMEKDTVLFYRELLDSVPAEYGLDKLEEIIEEEKAHLVTLTRELDKVE